MSSAPKCPFNHGASAAQPTATPLAELLRDSTKDTHTRAEHHPMQQSMVKGEISKAQFAELAGEMRQVHLALATGRKLLEQNAKTIALLEAMKDMEPIFQSDLGKLGFAVLPSKTKAATDYSKWVQTRVAANDAAAIVGAHYVLEGSTNGGMFISRAVERAMSLPPGEGTTWLNPFGADVRTRWKGFQGLLNDLGFDAEQGASAVAGANATFAVVEAICEELWTAQAVPA